MSILLNALNKTKTYESNASEIEQLIATSLDEAELDETESPAKSINFQKGLLLLLTLIVMLLVGILWVMISEKLARQHDYERPVVDRGEVTFVAIDSASESSSLAPVTGSPSESNTGVDFRLPHSKSAQSEASRFPISSGDKPQPVFSDPVKTQLEYLEQYRPQREVTSKGGFQSQRDAKTLGSGVKTSQAMTEKATRPQSLNTQLPIKLYDGLTAVEKMMVNEVKIDAHVYSKDAAQRFIFVEGQLKQEGDPLINSWVLESILDDGIIINNGVLRVKLAQP